MNHLLPTFLGLTFIVCGPVSSEQDDSPPATEQMTTKAAATVVLSGGKPLPSPAEIAKLPADGGPNFNRLVFESSPYLLQHAANPVDWYPWGDEAFELAKTQDKPVFLSVGYSSCHWCHVMEHESFEDEEVAKLLNEHFICIKVDREERPDIDHIYMSVTQAMTESGGWPMTVVMTPDRKPFFAGTYFPKDDRLGRRGMMTLVPYLAGVWKNDRAKVSETATNIAQWMEKLGDGNPGGELGRAALALGFEQLSRRFDPKEGGFGMRGPKFPVPHNILFLLQFYQRSGNESALDMAVTTLRKMRRGGIWDHVGYGFHRYSTDRVWLVPHFEKMLYDQALLAMAYTAAWQVTGDEEFGRTAREIITYVLRDMTAPEGGFYSAEDADSEGEEGLFYLWTMAELEEVLGKDETELFAEVYGAEPGGNWTDPVAEHPTLTNILHLAKRPDEIAQRESVDRADIEARLEASRAKLFDVRLKRVHSFKDDKILTDWNGLMIAALARAAQAFDDPEIERAARRAADFALDVLRDENGRLFKRSRRGNTGLPGTLEDYAFLSWGLLDLYEATFEVRYLEAARDLTDTMAARFGDTKRGGFFLSADDASEDVVRSKEAYDGAIPSGTSVAAWNLLRLGRITGRAELEELADKALRAHSGTVAKNPSAHTQMLAAVDFAVGPSFEVVIAGALEADDTTAMARAFRSRYVPNKVLLHRPLGDAPPITKISPFTLAQTTKEDATAFVCKDFACKLPTKDIEVALSFLDPKKWE